MTFMLTDDLAALSRPRRSYIYADDAPRQESSRDHGARSTILVSDSFLPYYPLLNPIIRIEISPWPAGCLASAPKCFIKVTIQDLLIYSSNTVRTEDLNATEFDDHFQHTCFQSNLSSPHANFGMAKCCIYSTCTSATYFSPLAK